MTIQLKIWEPTTWTYTTIYDNINGWVWEYITVDEQYNIIKKTQAWIGKKEY